MVNLVRFISLNFRAAGLLGKSALLLVLAKSFDEIDVGIYGLLTSTVTFFLYLLGFDFYNYTARELLSKNIDQWQNIIANQFFFYFICYGITIPLIYYVAYIGLVPKNYYFILCAIIISEHISQELYRLIVITNRLGFSSLVLFIRSGLWCYILIFYSYVNDKLSLDQVFASWFVSNVCSIILSVVFFVNLLKIKPFFVINFQWIVKGLMISIFLMFGTISLRILLSLDRYFVEYFSNLPMVGIYSFYAGVCSSIIALIDAAIFSFRYPQLVSVHKTSSNKNYFIQLYNSFFWETVLMTLVLSTMLLMFITPLCHWLGRDIYLENINIFYILLLSIVFFSISHIPDLVFYALEKDNILVKAHVIALLCFLICVFFFASIFSALGVAMSVCFAFAIQCAYKFYHLGKIKDYDLCLFFKK